MFLNQTAALINVSAHSASFSASPVLLSAAPRTALSAVCPLMGPVKEALRAARKTRTARSGSPLRAHGLHKTFSQCCRNVSSALQRWHCVAATLRECLAFAPHPPSSGKKSTIVIVQQALFSQQYLHNVNILGQRNTSNVQCVRCVV